MRLRLLALLVAALSSASAHAAVGRFLSLDDASRRAQVVVEGTVTAVESFDDARWHRFVTRATVTAARTWRGDGTVAVQVLLLGGEVGDRAQVVPGEATLRLGERVLLFLEPIPDRAELRPVGMKQGLFRPAARGGWQREFDGLSLVDPGQTMAHGQPPETLPAADLPAVLQGNPFDPASLGPAAPATVRP